MAFATAAAYPKLRPEISKQGAAGKKNTEKKYRTPRITSEKKSIFAKPLTREHAEKGRRKPAKKAHAEKGGKKPLKKPVPKKEGTAPKRGSCREERGASPRRLVLKKRNRPSEKRRTRRKRLLSFFFR